jgi:hypothetical protein
MRKLVLVIAPPLVALLAWLFQAWPERPQVAPTPAAESAWAADQREADGPPKVPVEVRAGTPEQPPPHDSLDQLPATADGSSPPSAAAEASDPDAARPSAAPGTRLAELQRRALAGEPKAMRDWLDALEQCEKVFAPPYHPEAERYLDLLSEDWAARWQQYALPLLAPMADDCRALFPEQDEWRSMARRHVLRSEAIAALVAAGDPLAQLMPDALQMLGPRTPEQWARLQALALAALEPANPQSLVELGRTARYLSRFDSEPAWHLVACDLGLDCYADGALMRQICLSHGWCPGGDLESSLLRLLPPREWSRVQAQRQALREAIARGELAALFDRPPPRLPGGG